MFKHLLFLLRAAKGQQLSPVRYPGILVRGLHRGNELIDRRVGGTLHQACPSWKLGGGGWDRPPCKRVNDGLG